MRENKNKCRALPIDQGQNIRTQALMRDNDDTIELIFRYAHDHTRFGQDGERRMCKPKWSWL